MRLKDNDRKAIDRARESLATTVLNLHRVPGIGLEVKATPPCRALELVFRHLGVDVGPLASLAEAPDLRTAVNRLGRHNRVFGRKVDLETNWWRTNGEVLAVNHRTLGPCALVPSHSRWTAYIPSDDSEPSKALKVDATFAHECETVAFEFMEIPSPETKSLFGLLRTATRKRWGEIFARIWAGIASALLGLVIPIVTAIMINQVIPDGESSGVIGIGLALLVAAVATSILGLIGGLATLRFDNSIAFRTETMMLTRVLDRFRRAKNETDGEVIQRISAVNSAMGTVTHATDKVVVEGIRGFAHLILLLYYSWVLAIVALVTLAIGLITIGIEATLQNRFVAASQAEAGKSESLSIEMLEGLDSIRDRDIGLPLLLRWTAHRSQLSHLTYLSSTLSNVRTLLLTFLGGAVSLLVYYLVAEHYAGDLNSGNFVASTMAISTVMASLGKMAGVVAAIATVAPVFSRLSPLLKSTVDAKSGTDVPASNDYRFAFEDVSINDTSWGRTDLANCSFKTEANQLTVVASERPVTGRVLLECLIGLRAADEGRTLIDDRSLESIDATALRRLGAIMIETPKVLPVTLQKNLDLEGNYDDSDIQTAMARTGLDKTVEKLPLGMNTILDSRSTGPNLATLLAATRCLLNPYQFVIAIDQPVLRNTAWGRKFMKELAESQCTRIIASSNPDILAMADRILVFDEVGSLLADGDLKSLREGETKLPRTIEEAIR